MTINVSVIRGPFTAESSIDSIVEEKSSHMTQITKKDTLSVRSQLVLSHLGHILKNNAENLGVNACVVLNHLGRELHLGNKGQDHFKDPHGKALP